MEQRHEKIAGKALIKTFAFSCDEAGNRTSVILPDGRVLRYSFDAQNRETSVTMPDGEVVRQAYDATGSLSTRQYGDGTTLHNSYDSLGRLLRMETAGDKKGNAGIPDFTWTYDSNGNRLTMNRSDEGITRYSYDPLNQLVQAEFPDKDYQKFTYDPVGNRLKLEERKSTVTSTFDPANQITESVQMTGTVMVATVFTFDAAGNMAEESVDGMKTGYSWDANNRLLSVSLPNGQNEAYKYDTSNRRVMKTGKAGTYFLWLGNAATFEASTDWSDSVINVWLGGQMVARIGKERGDGEVVSPSEKPKVRYLHPDAIGSVVAETDSKGNVIRRHSYKPFGEEANGGGAADNSYRYVGTYGVRDGNSGYYMVNRYYDVESGEFISIDRLEAINPYWYANNNPVHISDPQGLSPWYGNWCGPGNIEAEPIDALDAACKKHDYCYKYAGLDPSDVYSAPKDECKKDSQKSCDHELCNSAKAFSASITNPKAAFAKYYIIKIFCESSSPSAPMFPPNAGNAPY